MPYLFNGRINQNDVFADIGCGQGRVLNWLLLNGFRNKIYGVEYESDIAEGLIKRLAKFNNVKILVGDALQLEFADATFFYMANPFDEELTRRFKNKLKNMASSDHPLTIIYYRILHLNVFTEDPDWSVVVHTIPREELDARRYLDDPSYRTYAVIQWRGIK